jgi:hypothetical protein
MRGFFMNDIDDGKNEVAIKIIMPAALIGEHNTVFKVTGNSPFEIRDKIPFYSKVEGVSVSVNNETKEPVKFLVSRTIDIVSYDTLLRIDYDNWSDGIYSILESLETIQSTLEEVKASGVSIMMERYSNYKIALVIPLYYVDHGVVVCKEHGSQLYTVYKGDPNKKSKSKSSKIKARIDLDETGLKHFELPEDAVFLLRSDKAVLKNTADFVKIERNIEAIDDLISIVCNFIDYSESK